MLIDSFGRQVKYLRVSVTERCNFRCQYCMPDKPFEWVPKEDILSFEELFSVIKIAVDDGVNKIRITGGEPLLRHDLDRFIAMINAYNQDIDLALTTNGYLLKQYAKSLYDAGLKRVNISLDSLDPATMQKIAQKDVLDTVLEGVEEALAVGLQLKLNMVPLWGINDSEVLFMLEYCKKRAIVVRFIEYMHNTHAKDSLRGMRS
ncbi:MAG: radical SAM protein, partial [Campylobacterota bacterium]